jgi:hypothetical protein
MLADVSFPSIVDKTCRPLAILIREANALGMDVCLAI